MEFSKIQYDPENMIQKASDSGESELYLIASFESEYSVHEHDNACRNTDKAESSESHGKCSANSYLQPRATC